MYRTELINIIRKNGYKAYREDVTINNVKKLIAIHLDGTDRIIYLNPYQFANEKEAFAVIEKAKRILDADSEDSFLSREGFMNCVKIALCASGKATGISKPSELDDIDEYLYLFVDDGDMLISSIVTEGMLHVLGIPVEDVWKKAGENTEKTSILRDMTDMEIPGMLVATNSNIYKGAVAALSKRVRNEFAKKTGCSKIIAIPSSVHEMIFMPYRENTDFDALADIISVVNGMDGCIRHEDVLGTRCYVLEAD